MKSDIFSSQEYFRRPLYVYGILFALLIMNGQLSVGALQTQSTQWSYPQTIPGYDPETWPPILIADQNRTVHAFASQWVHDEGSEPLRVIFYNRWTREQGWTTPTDIIISPYKEARLTDAYLDEKGMFHVVFFGGDSTGADIYYSNAPAALAGDARAWSVPMNIGKNAGDPEGGVFVEDDQGTLYVVYHGRQFGSGLYVMGSKDGGKTWSDSLPIFFTKSDEPIVSDLKAVKSSSGWLHVIWNVRNVKGQGRGIYHASLQVGNEWTEPSVLADADEDLGTQIPTIFKYNHTLFVLYATQIQESHKITMRRSDDNGQTWDDPSIIFPRHQGVNGSLSATVDGNNVLHLFFGQRIAGEPDMHGMWHSVYQSNRWVEPDAIIKGPLVRDLVNQKGFDPYQVQAVVSQGNTLLVTWRTDPLAGPNGIWYSYMRINAPELPVATLVPFLDSNNDRESAADTLVESMAVSTPSATMSSVDNLAVEIPVEGPLSQNNPSRSILTGSLSALILVLLLVVFYALRRSR